MNAKTEQAEKLANSSDRDDQRQAIAIALVGIWKIMAERQYGISEE